MLCHRLTWIPFRRLSVKYAVNWLSGRVRIKQMEAWQLTIQLLTYPLQEGQQQLEMMPGKVKTDGSFFLVKAAWFGVVCMVWCSSKSCGED